MSPNNAIYDDNSCEFFGCTDSSACNYNVLATDDDGSCDDLSIGGFKYLKYLEILVIFSALALVVFGFVLTSYSNTPGAGLGFMLIILAASVFVVLPGMGLLAIYFLLRRLKIVFSRKS